MAKLWPWEARAPKWHLAYFVPIDGHFGQVFEIWTSNSFCLPFTLTLMYKPSLKSIRPKLAILSQKKLQKLTKVAISQNPILSKCHSPKSLLQLHFSMNLSETFRIDVNMDFAHTNHGRFLIYASKKILSPNYWYMSWPSWPTHISKLCSHKNQGWTRWAPGVRNPLKSSVTGLSLLFNCYFEINFDRFQPINWSIVNIFMKHLFMKFYHEIFRINAELKVEI